MALQVKNSLEQIDRDGKTKLFLSNDTIRKLLSRICQCMITGFFYYEQGSKHESKFNEYGGGISSAEVPHIDIDLSFVPHHKNKSFRVVASHNGYVLCSFYSGYILCNPLTKQWVLFPSSGEKLNHYNTDLFCSRDSSKIMPDFDVICSCHDGWRFYLNTYCSQGGTWTKLPLPSDVRPLSNHNRQIPGAMFERSVYTWATRGSSSTEIQVYDLKEKAISFIKPPVTATKYSSGCCNFKYPALLGVSAGSLYLALVSDRCFRVWVFVNSVEWLPKNEISLKSFTVEPPAMITYKFYPLAFHPTNHNLVLMSFGDGTKVVLFDAEKIHIKLIEGIDCYPYYPVIPYSLSVRPPYGWYT